MNLTTKGLMAVQMCSHRSPTVFFSLGQRKYGRPKLFTALSLTSCLFSAQKKKKNYDAYMMSGGCVFNKLLKCGK